MIAEILSCGCALGAAASRAAPLDGAVARRVASRQPISPMQTAATAIDAASVAMPARRFTFATPRRRRVAGRPYDRQIRNLGPS